jgi:nondiscriminating glutamyl-tRNA synthetase
MIRTRFSPSPTGMIHLGNVRSALFSALYAEHAKGLFLLRIEDTDQSRSEEKFTESMLSDLTWLGMHWQEGPNKGGPHMPYFQSQRGEIYSSYYLQLEDNALAYPCFCTDQELALHRKLQLSRGHAPRYPGTCRNLTKEVVQERIEAGKKPALRFLVPQNKDIDFVDFVKGPQHFNSDDIGDFIIRRADGSSSFMFCNAIDDSLMQVTHVIRGEDHLSNTPRQLMILQALNMQTPQYGHLSLIMGDDGSKLSKRHGSFSLHDLREEGYLPIAVMNYLARLSHAYEEQKLLSFEELAHAFNVEKISRASARFDKNQLLHWQKEAVLKLDAKEAWQWLGETIQEKVPADKREMFIDVMRKNIVLPSEAITWSEKFFENNLTFSDEQLSVLSEAGDVFFDQALVAVNKHGLDLKTMLDEMKNNLGISGKRLFMPVRIALTGEDHGPELIHIATLLGVSGMIQRFESAKSQLRK